MSQTWRTRKRRPSSSRRSAQADTGRCGCARAGRASRPVRARRARTRSRSRSGSVHAAVGPPPSTDLYSLKAAGSTKRTQADSVCDRGRGDRRGSWDRRERDHRHSSCARSRVAARCGRRLVLGRRPLDPGGSRWPREESNLRARIRSPSLYPLSYGAVRSSVAASTAKSKKREGG
jgi:hypothetical protein